MSVVGVVGGKAIISLIEVINGIILFIPAVSVINVTLFSPRSTRKRYFCEHFSVRGFAVGHAYMLITGVLQILVCPCNS